MTPTCTTEADCAVGEACAAQACQAVPLQLHLSTQSLQLGIQPVNVDGVVERQDGSPSTGVHLPRFVAFTRPTGGVLESPASPAIIAGDGSFHFVVQAAIGVTASASLVATAAPASPTTLTVEIRTMPPTVTVEVLPVSGTRPASWGNPTAYRRDEVALVKVSAPELLEVRALKVGDAEATPGGACGCAVGDPTCACFQAELWKPTLAAVTATVPLQVFAANANGVGVDGGVAVDGGRPGVVVTRVRWTVTPSGDAFRSAPVLDDEGTVYVGDQRNTTNGNIYAYDPRGTVKAGWDAGVSVGSVTSLAFSRGVDAAVGVTVDDRVYFNANTTSGGMLRDVSVGGVVSSGWCDSSTGNVTSPVRRSDSAMALVAEASSGVVSAIAHFGAVGGTSGAACMWNDGAGVSRALKAFTDDTRPTPAGSLVQGTHNLIVANTAPAGPFPALLYVGPANGLTVRQRDIVASNAFGSTVANLNSPTIGTDPASSANGISHRGVASAGSLGEFTLAANITAGGGLWRLSPRDSRYPGSSVSPAVVGRTGVAWSHAGGFLNSTDFGTRDTSVPFPGAVVASPVLTQDAAGFADRIFVVNTLGDLASMKLTGTAIEWAGATGLTSVSASPAFDCNRLASTPAKAATGILYVASGDGKLASIIVDSPKLDIWAKWPKYQRDAFNSGNTFLTFDNCP